MQNLPKGEKNKLSVKDKEEILELKGKKSAYVVAKQYGVSHTMIYKIWKNKNRNQKKPKVIDVSIIQKLFEFFSNPAIRGLIPDNFKNTLISSLTSEEKERIKEIRSVIINE